MKRMQEIEEENRRLKQMYANLSLEHEVLKDIIEKNSRSKGTTKASQLCDCRIRTERTTGLSNGAYERFAYS